MPRNASLLGGGTPALRKLVFHFLANSMGYDHGDSFPFDFEPNGIPFGSENRKENGHHDHIQFNLKADVNIFPGSQMVDGPAGAKWLTVSLLNGL